MTAVPVPSVKTSMRPRLTRRRPRGTPRADGASLGRASIVSAATAAKQVATAFGKYATNHIVAHVPSYRLRHAWYRYVLGWDIAPRVAVYMGQQIESFGLRGHGAGVSIGDGTIINPDCLLNTVGGLAIGRHVSISARACLITGAHDMNDPQFSNVARPIVIGDHVWIGTNATILGGVTIGDGAVICAGAVVRSDVRPNAIVDGVPGKVVGMRRLANPSYEFDFHPLFE